MRYFGCSVRKITSVLIRPGPVVRIRNGPPKHTFYQELRLLFVCTKINRWFQNYDPII